MTDDDPSMARQGHREAIVETTHDAPEAVAAALAPDNTDDVTMAGTPDGIRTRIVRPTTGGLSATLDDYLVNLSVAERTAALVTEALHVNEQHMTDNTERHTRTESDDE